MSETQQTEAQQSATGVEQSPVEARADAGVTQSAVEPASNAPTAEDAEKKQLAEMEAAQAARVALAGGVSPGRIVLYSLSARDADQINRRRGANTKEEAWPKGAVAHVGNYAYAGDIVPATVVRVWGETGCLNAQATLDGNDSLWLTSVSPAEKPTEGSWHWPRRV